MLENNVIKLYLNILLKDLNPTAVRTPADLLLLLRFDCVLIQVSPENQFYWNWSKMV